MNQHVGIALRSLFILAVPLLGLAQTVTFTRDVLAVDARGIFADFNNDGREDLLSSCGSNSDQIAVSLSRADGTYDSPACYHLPSGSVFASAAGDFNSDGNLDLIVANGSNTLYELLNDGKGTFHVQRSIATSVNISSLVAADVNHDSVIDLVGSAFDDSKLHVYFGNPDGTFQVGPTTDMQFSRGLSVGDFDGDGKADVVSQSSFYGTAVQIAYGDGQGHFQPTASFSGNVQYKVFDVDGDGRTDLIGSPFDFSINGNTYYKEVRVLYGNSNRTLTTQSVPLPQCTGPIPHPVSADLNGDGIIDIVSVESSDCSGNPPFTVDVLLGKGNRSFGPGQTVFSPTGVYPITEDVMRVNRDSKPDLKVVFFTSDTNEPRTYLLTNTTPGAFPKCSPPMNALGFNLCSPIKTVYSSTSVRFSIAAGNQTPGRKVEVWVDGKKLAENLKAFSHYSFLDATLNLSPGTHRVALFSAGSDNLVQNYRWTGGPGFTIPLTVGSSTCPAQEGIIVCSPLNDATLGSSVLAWAVAHLSRTNVIRMEVWVDGVKKYSTFGSSTLKTRIDLPSGLHRFTYYVVGADGTKLSSTVKATVR